MGAEVEGDTLGDEVNSEYFPTLLFLPCIFFRDLCFSIKKDNQRQETNPLMANRALIQMRARDNSKNQNFHVHMLVDRLIGSLPY
jgi:hypothetical protein